jgi:hypothetical protein
VTNLTQCNGTNCFRRETCARYVSRYFDKSKIVGNQLCAWTAENKFIDYYVEIEIVEVSE